MNVKVVNTLNTLDEIGKILVTLDGEVLIVEDTHHYTHFDAIPIPQDADARIPTEEYHSYEEEFAREMAFADFIRDFPQQWEKLKVKHIRLARKMEAKALELTQKRR